MAFPASGSNVSRKKQKERKERNIIRKSGSQKGKSPSRMIDERIKELGDWRGKMLSQLRTPDGGGRRLSGIGTPWSPRSVRWRPGAGSALDKRAAPGRESLERGVVRAVWGEGERNSGRAGVLRTDVPSIRLFVGPMLGLLTIGDFVTPATLVSC